MDHFKIVLISDQLKSWLERSEKCGINILALTIETIKEILRPFEDKVTIDEIFKKQDKERINQL